jgi:hypothetical protein
MVEQLPVIAMGQASFGWIIIFERVTFPKLKFRTDFSRNLKNGS